MMKMNKSYENPIVLCILLSFETMGDDFFGSNIFFYLSGVENPPPGPIV